MGDEYYDGRYANIKGENSIWTTVGKCINDVVEDKLKYLGSIEEVETSVNVRYTDTDPAEIGNSTEELA